MAAIEFAYTEVNTQVTANNASWADVAGASIASGEFETGKKYLLLVTAQNTSTTHAGNFTDLRVIHGSTAFAESVDRWYAPVIGYRKTYQFFTVWTAVASEGIKLQQQNSGGITQGINFISMLALNLADDLTENTDWFYNERTTDDALTTSPTNGAAVTFTPGSASDWLVLSLAEIQHGVNSVDVISELVRSGEASSAIPACRLVVQSATGADSQLLLARVYALTNASNTFTERSTEPSSTTHTRLNSKVFALNLNKFRNHASVFNTGASINLGTSSYGNQLQTVDLTPDVTSTVFVLATWMFDANHYTREAFFRHQQYQVGQSQVDVPAGQTTAAYNFTGGRTTSTEEVPFSLLTRYSGTGAVNYRHDLDASADDTANTPAGQQAGLVVFTAELAAAAPPDAFVKIEIRAAP